MKKIIAYKKSILILIDLILINLSYLLAVYLRYDYGNFKEYFYEEKRGLFIL